MHSGRTSSHTLFQQFTDPSLQAAKARIVTCEEVVDEKDEKRYQRAAGFLPGDGEAALEAIDLDAVKTFDSEIADSETRMDPFAGLYQIDAADSNMGDTDMDNNSELDADVEEPDLERLGEPHGHSDGYRRQPPTVPDAQLALEDLTSLLRPPRQKQNGSKAKYTVCKAPLPVDPITLARLEDIRSFLWRYCDFDTNGKPKNPSAGIWIKASVDVASCRTKGSWRARTL